MNLVTPQAFQSDPYRPKEPGDVSGTFDFMPDLITSDGWVLAQEALECRCRYLVHIVRRPVMIHSAMTEPPRESEVKETGDFEMRVVKRNPDRLMDGQPRRLDQWVPVPADLMAYVNRWIEGDSSFYEDLFQEARERADD